MSLQKNNYKYEFENILPKKRDFAKINSKSADSAIGGNIHNFICSNIPLAFHTKKTFPWLTNIIKNDLEVVKYIPLVLFEGLHNKLKKKLFVYN